MIRISSRTKRMSAAALAVLGWAALGLQLMLLLGVAAHNLTLTEALIRFFSYFTVQANILAAIVLSAFALKRGPEDWLVHPFVRSAVAVYIAVVGLVYVTVLSQLWQPQGQQLFADVVLHYAMPLGYLVFWCVAVRKNGLRWHDPLLWLIYPAAYLIAILIRGKMSGFYPYPFIDVGSLGYAKTALNAAGMLMVFVGVGAIVVVAGRLMSRSAEK